MSSQTVYRGQASYKGNQGHKIHKIRKGRKGRKGLYSGWFYLPAGIVYTALFLIPTFTSLFFSLTRWSLFDWQFIGFANFVTFFEEPALVKGFVNTLVYAVITCSLKVVVGMMLAIVLTSQVIGRTYLRAVVFFPTLVSTIGVGVTFTALLDPADGLVNKVLGVIGIAGPDWLTDPSYALISVAMVDVWKGVGLSTLIYIAGMASISKEYSHAAKIDGAGSVAAFVHITLPLCRPATTTVIILSLINGLRSFDLVWAMTKGGPGFTSDVVASVIYKQYQAGYYGLSTAGNVVLFLVVTAIVVPLWGFLNRREVQL